MEPRYLAPILDTFVRALPHTYRNTHADEGTHVQLSITGDSGGVWSLIRENNQWNLYVDVETQADAQVVMTENDAWKLFTKTLGKEEVGKRTMINGDQQMGERILNMVSVIA